VKKIIFDEPGSNMDSAAACLRIICNYYDDDLDLARFREKIGHAGEMATLHSISRVAETLGLRARCARLTYRQLTRAETAPCIIEWAPQDFVVVMPGSFWKINRGVKIADPSKGIVLCKKDELIRRWIGEGSGDSQATGLVLLLEEPTLKQNAEEGRGALNWRVVLELFRKSKWQIARVIMALVITSLVQLVIPFLMQGIVDIGINGRDLHYITIVLIAQLALIVSRVTADLIRGRILLYTSTSVNLSILSDFWIKLMKLPLAYFDRRHTGEVLQRINDNRQIQSFVTGPALNTFFSMLNFLIFSVVLMFYRMQLFLIFAVGIFLYLLWTRYFLKFRRKINKQVFLNSSKENNITLQLVQGMTEIRLQGIEQSKRWEWESMQVKIFKLSFRNLTYTQLQMAGAILINQGKDIILTFTVAKLLIEGQLTFGAMLAVQYIIGQLVGPVEQFIGFVQSAQDAKIAMERLNEIHRLENEEKEGQRHIRYLPLCKTITASNLVFAYGGENVKPALSSIQLEIPEGKITALVGESGCGKTTLLKLLLKFYDGYEGDLKVGNVDFKEFSPSFWRSKCGAVLQDSYIFNDTIKKNIAMDDNLVNMENLREACRTANILPFIESLPDGFDTMLEVNGSGISQGQKQRLLIARAIYKDPEYVFFDESTNSLDEISEKTVVKNLQHFFENRTVVLVAHRLSTVKHAHNIVVMHQGRIVEQGTHEELTRKKGRYFRLIRSQVELAEVEEIGMNNDTQNATND
jgi:ATP-binding cassette subfamily B protein